MRIYLIFALGKTRLYLLNGDIMAIHLVIMGHSLV